MVDGERPLEYLRLSLPPWRSAAQMDQGLDFRLPVKVVPVHRPSQKTATANSTLVHIVLIACLSDSPIGQSAVIDVDRSALTLPFPFLFQAMNDCDCS